MSTLPLLNVIHRSVSLKNNLFSVIFFLQLSFKCKDNTFKDLGTRIILHCEIRYNKWVNCNKHTLILSWNINSCTITSVLMDTMLVELTWKCRATATWSLRYFISTLQNKSYCLCYSLGWTSKKIKKKKKSKNNLTVVLKSKIF